MSHVQLVKFDGHYYNRFTCEKMPDLENLQGALVYCGSWFQTFQVTFSWLCWPEACGKAALHRKDYKCQLSRREERNSHYKVTKDRNCCGIEYVLNWEKCVTFVWDKIMFCRLNTIVCSSNPCTWKTELGETVNSRPACKFKVSWC